MPQSVEELTRIIRSRLSLVVSARARWPGGGDRAISLVLAIRSRAVQRYRPSGTADVRIAVPARAAIFRIRCEIAGLPAPLARI